MVGGFHRTGAAVMKEIVIISGKGGTGKTSTAAALASYMARTSSCVFADCDVDAADLHLIFSPTIQTTHEFISGMAARIVQDRCLTCGKCATLCRFDAIARLPSGKYRVEGCEGCGVCARFCPVGAIDFLDRRCGEWYESETRFGPLVHANLDAGAENSGKLVTEVRRASRSIAEASNADYLLVDGSPGIGCPVIASITGCDAAIAVVEPTASSKHDLDRVIELTAHFNMPLWVVINKFDINEEVCEEIEAACRASGVRVAGRIGYDPAVTKAQVQGQSIVEYDAAATAALHIQDIWQLMEETWKRSK